MRKFLCMILVLSLVLGMGTAAFAADTGMESVSEAKCFKKSHLVYCQALPERFEVQNENGERVHVNINGRILKAVDGKMVKEIIEENNLEDGSTININNIGYAEKEETKESPMLKSGPGYITTYSYGTERTVADKFVISVAKGSSTTLKAEWSYAIKGELEAGANVYDLATVVAKLGGSVKCTYSVTKKFSGPGESSKYNSREFRVKFYKQKVTVTQTNELFPSMKTTFVYDKAVRYAEYSIDRKI